jgi:D-3-phosphoglycerate dehydrogenase
MSLAQDIPIVGKVARSASNSWQNGFSTSPTLNFQNRAGSFSQSPGLTRSLTTSKTLKPFATKDIKVLLLENVNKTGQDILRKQGYQVEALKTSLKEDELIEKIRYAKLLILDSSLRTGE